MRTRVLTPFALSCLLLFAACSASHPTAHVIINNDSDRDIPLNLSISNKDKDTAPRKPYSNNIKPGLQELAPEKLPKGMYAICAETNNGLVLLPQKRYRSIRTVGSSSILCMPTL
jgi:hypothetical protein